MDKFDKEDILDVTDTSGTSSDTGVFETKPFVLELHELKKDDPASNTVAPVLRIKRKKKRSQQPTDARSRSSSSNSALSDSVPKLTDAKEVFYDADRSFHEISEDSQVKPPATATLAPVDTDQTQNPKSIPGATTQSQRTSTSPRQLSKTLTKPVIQPK